MTQSVFFSQDRSLFFVLGLKLPHHVGDLAVHARFALCFPVPFTVWVKAHSTKIVVSKWPVVLFFEASLNVGTCLGVFFFVD